MIEDILSHDERLRLECLAQANARAVGSDSEKVVDVAKKFEEYVRGTNG